MSFDITIPYNNRRLLELLLSTSIEKRIHAIPHKDIMRVSNKEIADIGISVTNVKHTNKRAKMEKNLFRVSIQECHYEVKLDGKVAANRGI